MQCPVCKTVNLTMADRQGIEIDYCPQCRGVWLDRGELDKLIERSAGQHPIPTPAVTPNPEAPGYVMPAFAPPTQPAQSAPIQSPPPPHYRGDERHYADRDQRSYDSRYPDKDYRYGHKRKRESFLSDLFDFD